MISAVHSSRFRSAVERAFCRLVLVGGLAVVGDDSAAVDSVPVTVDLSGDLRHGHDPAGIRAHGQYDPYSTGGGIQWRSSPNAREWAYRGDVLEVPTWAENIAGEDLWAPDIAHFNGRYHLYYSASTFGSGDETDIRMRRLDPKTGKPSAEDETLYSRADRPHGNRILAS